MFSLIKQVLIVSLSLSESLAHNQRKRLFLNDGPCMVRPTLIDMNLVQLKYYPLIISLIKCTGSFNVLSRKICVTKETREINVKSFKMITNKHEIKTMTEQISCGFKCKFSITIFKAKTE